MGTDKSLLVTHIPLIYIIIYVPDLENMRYLVIILDNSNLFIDGYMYIMPTIVVKHQVWHRCIKRVAVLVSSFTTIIIAVAI